MLRFALLAAHLSAVLARGCQLWTSAICQHLEGYDLTDGQQVDNLCAGLCLRHRGCDTAVRAPSLLRPALAPAHNPRAAPPQCKCVAMNYEGTCQCDIGECGAQRERMICELGCPYWEYSCKGLCQCLVQQGACPAETLHEPPPLELAPVDAMPAPPKVEEKTRAQQMSQVLLPTPAASI